MTDQLVITQRAELELQFSTTYKLFHGKKALRNGEQTAGTPRQEVRVVQVRHIDPVYSHATLNKPDV